jgi:hypothetical protein
MRASLPLLWAAVTLTACDESVATTMSRAQAGPSAPAPNLSPAARAQLAGSIDLVAMDRLLFTLGEVDRQRFLATFSELELVANGTETPRETTDVTFVVYFSDPEQQKLLDRTWAPLRRQDAPGFPQDQAVSVRGRAFAEHDTLSEPAGTEREP